ncbi:hypothetical protein FDZ84_07770 [Saccharopolyspora sp. ASAGF58]|nr:hypothetical protein FDZ84_07770 [Saccharopolyspora sp. ASAGF58]
MIRLRLPRALVWDHNAHYHPWLLRQHEIHVAAAQILPGAQVRRRLFWRYALVWRKPFTRIPTT